MFDEELPQPKKPKPIDLESFSIEDLEARILHLEGEIEHAKAMIKSKKASLDAANAIFGNHNR